MPIQKKNRRSMLQRLLAKLSSKECMGKHDAGDLANIIAAKIAARIGDKADIDFYIGRMRWIADGKPVQSGIFQKPVILTMENIHSYFASVKTR